jgi:hypothetical protein
LDWGLVTGSYEHGNESLGYIANKQVRENSQCEIVLYQVGGQG